MLGSQEADRVSAKGARKRGRAGGLKIALVGLLVAVILGIAWFGYLVWSVIPGNSGRSLTGAEIAIRQAQEKVTAQPQNIDARLQLADVYFSYEYYEEAGQTLDEARSSFEPTGVAGAYLETAAGRVAQAQGDISGAVEHLNTSIEFEPTFDALYRLGEIRLEQGDRDSAIENWAQALEVKPEAGGLHVDLAKLYEERGDATSALRHWQEAARFMPDDPEIQAALERLR